MKQLVDALSAMPGIEAEVNPYVDGGEWMVSLILDRVGDELEDDILLPTAEAWLSLMFVAYGIRSSTDVRLELIPAAPLLNPVADGWALVGWADQSELAGLIDKLTLIPMDGWAVDEALRKLEEEQG